MTYNFVRNIYIRLLRSRISDPLQQQRIKLLWFMGGYWPLLWLKNLPWWQKGKIILRFLKIDWYILHAHKPFEIAVVCVALSQNRAAHNEIMVEAGCFQGGSSAKFSILCSLLGYHLWIYDSFEGVEKMNESDKEGTYDYSGQYVATEKIVFNHIEKFGSVECCEFHKGWFADTIARQKLAYPVQIAYIDCDLAKGTLEVLTGIVPALTDNGVIFSQDYHITPVRKMLHNPKTWELLKHGTPDICPLGRQIARITFDAQSADLRES